MHVLRGRKSAVDADRHRTGAMVDHAVETGATALRVWTPPRQVAFGRRDASADGYERARAIARQRGFPPVERQVGGRAVAYTGSTVAFVHADPTTERTAVDSRYEDAIGRLRAALGEVGVDAREGEPDGAFCPGTHSLQSAGKIAGLAQRARKEVALVGGIVVVRDHEAVAEVLAPIYDALGVSFDPDAVGSVARAGDESHPDAVCDAIVDAFADGAVEVERVRGT
jgi:octanoyl-[GcvH]:protein N-octanoyltransferase